MLFIKSTIQNLFKETIEKRLKLLFLVFILCTSLVSVTNTSAEHFEGRACDECHFSHLNDEYKLLSGEKINSGEIACFTCHASNKVDDAPDTYREFNTSQSHHPLGTDTECGVCHLQDDSHNNGKLNTWPEINLKDPDPEDSHIYNGTKINDFCLSCHDNSPVTLGNPPETPIDLSSAYEFTGHGRIDINEPCTSCHEHHSSLSKPYMIKDVINNSVITGNDNSVCFACHAQPSESYPGKETFLSSEHGTSNKFCVDCHNPHGDNKDLCYLCHNDQYSAHYSNKRDKLCVDCHNPHQKDGLKMTREDEEKLCFLCHQDLENEFGNLRDGKTGWVSHHKVDDEEYKGGKVECVDCHNPHTVTKFNIVSEPGSSGTGMPPTAFPEDAYKQRATIYNQFCLSCHDGSRFSAADIKSELDFSSNIETEFTSDGEQNLHFLHQNQGYGCQNCHDAHSSRGTQGIQRGALLHEEISVQSWDQSSHYDQGKSSCSSVGLGLGCH